MKKTLEEQLKDMKIKDETLIKYYNLIARSRKVASDLEVNLQKHFIAKAQTEDGALETLSQPTYNSEEFDILYKKSNSKKNVELVVKATTKNLLELQDYLLTSGFGTIETRSVSYANFSFATPEISKYKNDISSYMKMVGNYLKSGYPQLVKELTVRNRDGWSPYTLSTGIGMIYGPVIDVLEVRKVLLQGVHCISLKKEAVTFSSKIP